MQILLTVITTVYRCVYSFMCVLPVRVKIAKIISKYRLYEIEHFHSNDASPAFVLLDLDLHFHGKSFGVVFDW